MDRHLLRKRIILLVVDLAFGDEKANDENIACLMSGHIIVKDFHVISGHQHDTSTRRNIGNHGPFGSKVVVVVVYDLIPENSYEPAVRESQSGQVEHENTARVVGNGIVIDVRTQSILNLNPGDVLLCLAASNDDILRLTDINPGI